MLVGKRRRAVLGEYIGSKYLVYGFDVVCVGSSGQEKWRMVEDAWDVRIKYTLNDKAEWFMPTDEVFEPFIDADLFDNIQVKLEERRSSTPKRSPRSEDLWLGGLWWDEDTKTKLAGNSQGKHFRVKHPDHEHKRLTFKEAEWFIGVYLRQIGQRLDTMSGAVEDRKLLERLETDEWLKELHFEYIRLEIESYLESKLKPGMNRVGGVEIILDHDHERNAVLTTDGNLLELYCEMVKEDMERNQTAVQGKMDERKRLTLELMAMKDKDQFIIDTYNERIGQLSKEIEAATSVPNFMEWWQQVQEEIGMLQRQQEQVKQAVEQGSYIQKAEAIRSLIDSIVCHWTDVPTTDKRYKSGCKTVCRAVTITSKAMAKTTDGLPIETMTIETPSAWSS